VKNLFSFCSFITQKASLSVHVTIKSVCRTFEPRLVLENTQVAAEE